MTQAGADQGGEKRLFPESKNVSFRLSPGQKRDAINEAILPKEKGASVAARKAVLNGLFGFAGNYRTCWPREEKLGERIGLSVPTVRRALRSLERAGLVFTRRRNSSAGAISNSYELLWPAIMALGRTGKPAVNLANAGGSPPIMVSDGLAEPTAHGERPTAHGERPTAHHERAGSTSSLNHSLNPPPPAPRPNKKSWQAAAGELSKEGIGEAAAAIEDARRAGCRPEQVLDLIGFYRSRPGCWGAGGLKHRVSNARPDQAADDLRFWVPPRRQAVDTQSRAERIAEARARRVDEAERYAQIERERQRVTLALMTLDDAAIERAIAETFAGQEMLLTAAWRAWRDSGREGLGTLFGSAIAGRLRSSNAEADP